MKIVVVNEHSEGYGISVEPTGDYRLVGLGTTCTLDISGGDGDAELELFVYISKERTCISHEKGRFFSVDIAPDGDQPN